VAAGQKIKLKQFFLLNQNENLPQRLEPIVPDDVQCAAARKAEPRRQGGSP
jgi:hypothetical protein